MAFSVQELGYNALGFGFCIGVQAGSHASDRLTVPYASLTVADLHNPPSKRMVVSEIGYLTGVLMIKESYYFLGVLFSGVYYSRSSHRA